MTSGIPVVIVSHQLDRIASLCTDAIVLERGTVAYRGTPSDAIGWYLSGSREALDDENNRSAVRLRALSVVGDAAITSGEGVEFTLDGSVEDAELLVERLEAPQHVEVERIRLDRDAQLGLRQFEQAAAVRGGLVVLR